MTRRIRGLTVLELLVSAALAAMVFGVLLAATGSARRAGGQDERTGVGFGVVAEERLRDDLAAALSDPGGTSAPVVLESEAGAISTTGTRLALARVERFERLPLRATTVRWYCEGGRLVRYQGSVREVVGSDRIESVEMELVWLARSQFLLTVRLRGAGPGRRSREFVVVLDGMPRGIPVEGELPFPPAFDREEIA